MYLETTYTNDTNITNNIVKSVFTNVYGVARTLIALGTLLLLIFNDINELIPLEYYEEVKNYPQSQFNLFYCVAYDNIYVIKFISCVILLFVIIGILPQITGFLHYWVTFSVYNSVMAVEGGDQIASIILILLVPVTIFDKRISHWHKHDYFTYKRPELVSYFCYTCILVIRVQIAILYLDAGVEKLKVEEWVDGTATYYWFNHNLFGAPGWMKFCFGWIFINSLTVTIITWGVIILEILIFCGFFMQENQKIYIFILGILFHFIIFLVHGLPNFALSMFGALVLYLLPIHRFLSIPLVKKNRLYAGFRRNGLSR